MPQTIPHYRVEVVPLTPLFGRRDPRFSYASLKPIASGSLVSISFGQRVLTGVTLDCAPLPGPVPGWMKYIGPTKLESWLTEDQITLAWQLSERLFTPLGMIFKLFFPLMHPPRSKKISSLSQTLPSSKERKVRSTHRCVNLQDPTHLQTVSSDVQLFEYLVKYGKRARRNKQMLVILVPEVLTAELFARKLQAALPTASIGCLSSRRTDVEHYEIFQSIRTQSFDIVIGTRQLVFAPFNKLSAIIIVDAEKQVSYTQWEMAPRYDATLAAQMITQRKAVPCIHISPAPGLTYFAADIDIRRTGQPFAFSKQHTLTPIDLRKTVSRHRGGSVLTSELIQAIRTAHANNSSVLILVKQRGLSRFSLCAKCHTPQRCPKCETGLSEMTDGRFRCLACSYRGTLFPSCVNCGHMHFKSFGAGTQSVERNLKRECPAGSILVIDRDMIQRKPAFQKVVSALHRPDSPQTIIATYETAYSLPLPPLGLIAMIEPDQALYYPDYQARERLWRTLRRFGAKLKPNGVLSVQTFEPESALWTTWVSQKQALTAAELLAERKMLCYPPYFNLIQLECYPRKTMTSRASAEQAESLLRQATLASDVQILPKYLPFNRKNRYHILIRYPRLHVLPPTLQQCLLALDPTIRLTHNPISLLG